MLADLLGDPTLADGLPLGMTHPMDCAATLVFDGPGGVTANVLGMIGTDTVSQTFAYHVVLEALLATETWIGQPAAVTFARDSTATVFGGMIAEVATSGDAFGNGYTVVTISPFIQVLGANADYRVFQEQTTPGLIGTILGEAGLGWQDRMVGSYDAMECAVQYGESDLDFVKRSAERSGVFFYFDEDGEPIFADPGGGFGGGGPSLAYPSSSVPLPPGEEAITGLKRGGWMTPDQTAVRGYRLADPSVPVDGTAGTGDGSREVYSLDASLIEQSMADNRAAVNLERLQIPLDVVVGTSTSADVRAGYGLTVVTSPAGGLDGDYSVIEVTHAFTRDGEGCLRYGNAFETVPAGVDYRPPLSTPVPKVQGLHTAIVTGPSGVPVYADELGRVIVQFIWDRRGGFDENSFCRVRVVQPAGTLGETDPFIPPVGEEVLVGFIQGDPSQPVVLGSLFNGQDEPPPP